MFNLNYTIVWTISAIKLPQRCDESHHYKQIHLQRPSVLKSSLICSGAILRRTRPNATCIIAPRVNPVEIGSVFWSILIFGNVSNTNPIHKK